MNGPADIAATPLARGAGEWRGPEQIPPAPWAPDGMTATGHISARTALGGSALVSDYSQEAGGAVSMHAHSVFVVDPETGEVTLYFFSSMSAEPQVLRGRADGDEMILEGRGSDGRMRQVFRYGPDVMEVEARAEAEDGEWTLLFEGRYTRSS
jgi:hypothetical protein